MINYYNPIYFPTAVLIADTLNSNEIGGVKLGADLIPPGLTKAGGIAVSAALEVDSQYGAILFPRLIQANINQMNMTDGMMFYNKTSNAFQFRINGSTETFSQGSGNVDGPGVTVIGNLPIWDNITGTLLADSGISINRIISGPSASTVGRLAAWDNTTGTSLEDSGVLISDIVKGPFSSTVGNIPVWDNLTGNLLSDSNLAVDNVISSLAGGPDGNIAVFDSVYKSIKDSGINISKVPVTPLFSSLNNRGKALVDLNRMENLNIIQFSTNGDNANDAYLSIADNVALMRLATLVKRDDSGIGSIIVSQSVAPDMSNTSAILEIQSTTQALLVSRMSTAQADGIPDKKDGMVIYDNITKKFKFREDGVWNQYASGNGNLNVTLFEPSWPPPANRYTAGQDDDVILVSSENVLGRIFLPQITPAIKGKVYTIKNINSGGFSLNPDSLDSIDGVYSAEVFFPANNFSSVSVISDGVSGWSIIDYYSGVITSNGYRLVDDSNYDLPTNIEIADNIVGVNLTFTGIVYLPEASLCKGREFTVKDESGTASELKRVIVEVSAAGTIDNALQAIIDTPYSSLTFYSNGTQWFIK